MEIKINKQILRNLWQNSSNIEQNGFFYDKVFDERDFWIKKWKINKEKLIAYKQILKREYFDYLSKLKSYDKYFKTEEFKKFLKIKNELKYVLDVLFNLWKLDAFYFWYEFKTDDWDKNDGSTVSVTSCKNPSNDSEVILFTIEGGGHSMPGSQAAKLPRILGNRNNDIDGVSIIWEFLKRHSR